MASRSLPYVQPNVYIIISDKIISFSNLPQLKLLPIQLPFSQMSFHVVFSPMIEAIHLNVISVPWGYPSMPRVPLTSVPSRYMRVPWTLWRCSGLLWQRLWLLWHIMSLLINSDNNCNTSILMNYFNKIT